MSRVSAESLRAEASVRVRLEETARAAAQAEDHVVSVSSGRGGVSAFAEPGGRYSVTVAIVAEIVPLLPLADRLREQIRLAAVAAGLGDELGCVDVKFENVEVREPAARRRAAVKPLAAPRAARSPSAPRAHASTQGRQP